MHIHEQGVHLQHLDTYFRSSNLLRVKTTRNSVNQTKVSNRVSELPRSENEEEEEVIVTDSHVPMDFIRQGTR